MITRSGIKRGSREPCSGTWEPLSIMDQSPAEPSGLDFRLTARLNFKLQAIVLSVEKASVPGSVQPGRSPPLLGSICISILTKAR